jgi:hypothetical protein
MHGISSTLIILLRTETEHKLTVAINVPMLLATNRLQDFLYLIFLIRNMLTI